MILMCSQFGQVEPFNLVSVSFWHVSNFFLSQRYDLGLYLPCPKPKIYFLKDHKVRFSGGWYLEAKILEVDVLIYIGVSLLPGPCSS